MLTEEKTIAGTWYTITCTAPATVTQQIDGETVELATLTKSGTSAFRATASTITIETEGKYHILPTKAPAALGIGNNSGGVTDITWDATPTSGSQNGVTSAGIYDADLHISLGTCSLAVGKNAVANNAYSVAMGEGAVTGGYYYSNSPTATITTVSTNTSGTNINSTPCFSTAVGYHASAARGACSAYGAYARAGSGDGASSSSYATASGYSATASGYSATASGYSATASGHYATASGSYATASGSYATASGYTATASGSSATASGYSATASGSYATASGYTATASGSYATASGSYATASGTAAIASGSYATASGSWAVAVGAGSNATGEGSQILGPHGRNGNDGCTVITALLGSAFTDCAVENAVVTQLYLIAAGSPLSVKYCGGEAGLGFVTTTPGVGLWDDSWSIVASGTKKLSELLSDNKNTFAPSMKRERATS